VSLPRALVSRNILLLERRVVGISSGIPAVERLWVGRVEWPGVLEALNQIRIGDEQRSKAEKVCRILPLQLLGDLFALPTPDNDSRANALRNLVRKSSFTTGSLSQLASAPACKPPILIAANPPFTRARLPRDNDLQTVTGNTASVIKIA